MASTDPARKKKDSGQPRQGSAARPYQLDPVQVVVPRPEQLGQGRIRRGKRGTVYDSPRVGKDGRVPTHLYEEVVDALFRGMTIDEYEDRALRQRNFSPAVRNVDRSLESLNPRARDAYQRLLRGADSAGVRFRELETRRPRDRQKYLFQQGRSRPGPIVTWTLTSNHERGNALDLSSDDRGYRWLDDNAGRYGFGRVRGDRPHIEYDPIAAAVAAAGQRGR